MPITINGEHKDLPSDARVSLLDFIREDLHLSGTKKGCNQGACGACTVLVEGSERILSCMALAVQYEGRAITTIEGLGTPAKLHPMQAAFVKHDAMQCGFCTPGMVMSCAALLERNPNPNLADVKHAVSGNLCRCSTYPKVFAATLDAAQQRRQSAGLVTVISEMEA